MLLQNKELNMNEEIEKRIVVNWYKNTKNIDVKLEDVFVVWQCKTIQNKKWIMSTQRNDHYLFELTYNGDKEEFYLDCYEKFDHQVINGKYNFQKR